MRSQCQLIALLGWERVILCHPARADEQNIANADISTLSGGTDINALRFSAGGELRIGDGVGGIAGVFYVLGLSVAVVVEEEGTAGESVLRPVVDAVFVVGGWADDVGSVDIVVEGMGSGMGELVSC